MLKVQLLEFTPFAAELCGIAAATCTNSDNPARSLKHAIASGHTSVLEHASFTFKVEGLSRAAMAQLTRHRIASFDVQSQRYVKLEDWNAVIPPSLYGEQKVEDKTLFKLAYDCIENSMEVYKKLLEAGVPAEDARYVTPQAITTELVMTMNARQLLHFFSLRTCNRAQWEIRALADEMLKICRRVSPELFNYAGPGCVTNKCPELKPCGHPRKTEEWD